MDALVKEALARVNTAVETVDTVLESPRPVPILRKHAIARAINAVDALKSALKTL